MVEPGQAIPNVILRPATTADAAEVADVYLASRRELVAEAPLVHSDEAIRQWILDDLIPRGNVLVAVTDRNAGDILGMMTTSRREGIGWLDHLYVRPTHVGRGLGTRMLNRAKKLLGSPMRLYTFQCNTGARRFYERHGFEVLSLGDGSGNEEGCPDALLEWKAVDRS